MQQTLVAIVDELAGEVWGVVTVHERRSFRDVVLIRFEHARSCRGALEVIGRRRRRAAWRWIRPKPQAGFGRFWPVLAEVGWQVVRGGSVVELRGFG